MEGCNPFSLAGKTVLITGGAGGIGSASALTCIQQGARVILTDIREDALQATLASLPESQASEPNLSFTADLTDAEQLAALVDFCPALDGLVCNAGVMKLIPTQFITEEELTRIQKINLNAPIMLTRSLLKKKKIKKGGSIVFTASAAGVYRVSIGNGIYATTKCGIDAFMRTVALEFGPKGIRCNSVNPGMVETALIGSFTEEEKQKGYRIRYSLSAF